MHERALHRAAALSAALLLLTASVAVADTLPGDTDDVTAGVQGTRSLGPVAVNGSIEAPLWFQLACRNAAHLDEGQTVALALQSAIVPTGGAVTSTGATVGPVPSEWPDDGEACQSPPVVRSSDPATVTLTAPGYPGVFDYVLDYSRTVSPAGSGDGSALTSLTGATFRLTVVANTPPTLVLPADMVVEGDSPGGAVVAYTVGASDAEDDPDPVAGCAPASGAFLPLGATIVGCVVTDSAGAAASGSFSISVRDTTPPTLAGVPGGVTQTTTVLSGTAADYALPSALDIVDVAPQVACAPAPGDAVPVGRTVVECTATDASGNVATATFAIDVTYVPPVVLETAFDEPIGHDRAIAGAAGRTVPVKARIVRDGMPVTSGLVVLRLARCDDGRAIGSPSPMAWQGERWMLGLDTAGLEGCSRATVSLDGIDAGSFLLRLGASAAAVKARGASR